MSGQCGKLVSLVLQEHFGEVVQQVGYHLFKYGVSPLWTIVKYTNLPVPKVKLALCVLIKYGLVEFTSGKTDSYCEYRLLSNNVLLILRYPKFVSHIKKLFDEESEILIEETLIRGYALASDLMNAVVARMKKNHERTVPLTDVRDKLLALVTARYLRRHSGAPEEYYILPVMNVQKLQEERTVHWCVNFDRFHQDMRDALLVAAVARRWDDSAAELMRTLLQVMYGRSEPWAETSNPVSVTELRDALNKSGASGQLQAYLEHYLCVLAEDESAFVRKMGDAGGGQYVVRLRGAVEQLCGALLENMVLERFDSRAARIFRLVRAKRYIEPEHIQQLAMIPGKEAKRISYQLLERGFLQAQELKKSNTSSGPNKSFVLFHVNMGQVARMVLELCLKAMYNCCVRRQHDKHVNRRLIDKKHRVDTISMSLKQQGAPAQQLADIQDMITPPEKELLDNIGKVMKRLNLAELELDDSLFLLQIYIADVGGDTGMPT